MTLPLRSDQSEDNTTGAPVIDLADYALAADRHRQLREHLTTAQASIEAAIEAADNGGNATPGVNFALSHLTSAKALLHPRAATR